MAKIEVPKKCGRVRVAVTQGNKYVVWNGKQGRGEFGIICRNKRQAQELCEKINTKDHDGTVILD